MLLRLLLVAAALAASGAQEAEKLTQPNPCSSKQTCSECMQTPSCAWCADPEFLTSDKKPAQRCNKEQTFINGVVTCKAEYLQKWRNGVISIRNDTLSSVLEASGGAAGGAAGAAGGAAASGSSSSSSSSSSFQATQIKPQHVRMNLRVNEASNLNINFALAPNYPIDLYYLMDLSKSMEDDKDKLSTLGNQLAVEMMKLTSNFRLGFGSFVDKVVMPYVSTVPANLESPCTGCAAPYGFHNALSLTDDTKLFAKEVREATVSGNLDAPEGGFDAIMQAIVCKDEIAWRSNARRLLVFSTDAGFHYAGDGKLGGVVKPNDGECHLNSRGQYTHSDMLDYPSVSQINQKVKQNSINVIFAVTSEQRATYNELSRHIEASSAGTLSNDSSNVVQLVKEQYDAITSFVEMKDNSTEFVKIRYYSACRGGGDAQETSRCDGLKIGEQVDFTAKIELIKCPDDPARWNDIIEIKPAGLNESLIIDLAMQCQCDCDRPGGPGYKPAKFASECNFAGDLKCGKCVCDEQHFGAFCECSQSDPNGRVGEEQCRPENSTGLLCNGRGECVCGQCQCYQRENEKEIVEGDFCECDNFSCDRHEKLLCSGPDHGACVCGACVCLPDWTGNACQCPASNASCVAPGETRQCSGAGVCECGLCKCKEDKDGRYSGRFCEDCPTCRGKCTEYRPCVDCVVFETGELKDECEESCKHLIINKTDVVEVESPDERMCTFSDDKGCRYRFVYGYDEDNNPVIRAQDTKKCPPAINILGIVLTLIAAIVVVGMAVLMLWKLLTTIHDRREYAKWDSERKMAKWDTGENPIYKQATSTYKNPAYGGK